MGGMVEGFNSHKGTKPSFKKDFVEVPIMDNQKSKYIYGSTPRTYTDPEGRTRLKARIQPLKDIDVSGMDNDEINKLKHRVYISRWVSSNQERYNANMRDWVRRNHDKVIPKVREKMRALRQQRCA